MVKVTERQNDDCIWLDCWGMFDELPDYIME